MRVSRAALVYSAACALSLGAGTLAARSVGAEAENPSAPAPADVAAEGVFASPVAPPRPGASTPESQASRPQPGLGSAPSRKSGESGEPGPPGGTSAVPEAPAAGPAPGEVSAASAGAASQGGGYAPSGGGEPRRAVPPAAAPAPQEPALPALPALPQIPLPTLTLRQIPVNPAPEPEPLRPLRIG